MACRVIAYDIGCVFCETVARSSLAELFRASGSRFCVNAFHGYSHSYHCQVLHHLITIIGAGIEDGETLERVFGSSNKLAPIIRFATAYHRQLYIHSYFKQWDAEKYSNIALMLYNNYKQALDIIREKVPALADALRELGYSEDDLKTFSEEERQYFGTLRDEDDKNLHAIVYVETLQELQKTM